MPKLILPNDCKENVSLFLGGQKTLSPIYYTVLSHCMIAFMKLYICNEKSNVLSWAITLLFVDPLTYFKAQKLEALGFLDTHQLNNCISTGSL